MGYNSPMFVDVCGIPVSKNNKFCTVDLLIKCNRSIIRRHEYGN
jgi:hypothetical protein